MVRLFFTWAATVSIVTGAIAQSWMNYGGNPQHSATYSGTSQTVSLIHWQASLDDDRSYYGGEVLIHYASPMISPSNTVVYGYRHTTTVNGSPDYDNWSVIGRKGSNGAQVWRLDTDYSAPIVWPSDWTSVFPISLCHPGSSRNTGVAAAAAAGSVMVRSSADATMSGIMRYVFYTTLTDFTKNEAEYAPIKINTPITEDGSENIYFGYEVTSSLPSNLSSLGTGGIVKFNLANGKAVYQSVESLGIDSSLTRPAMNASPALSNDGKSVYVALTGGDAQLAKLNTSNLKATAHVQLMDPSVSGGGAYLIDESSASPMVGTDGHVFMGVFGNQWRESHGWMLQFDANLSQTNSENVQYPVGSFGWDDTASVVPSDIVPSYHGKAPYLVLTKYNNYDDNGGDPGADGSNKVAVLDPTSNSFSRDRQTGIPVMNEIMTVLGPTLTNDDSQHPNARNEWCINSAAVDIKKKGAIINSEDGHMYRWSFASNSLTEVLDLAPATGEAYTSTAIGPDGQMYAINNSILFAVGDPVNASSVSVVQGTGGRGNVKDIWYKDGLVYSAGSVASSGSEAAAIEADFIFPTTSINGLTVTVYAAAANNVEGSVYAYNYTTKEFELLNTGSLDASQSLITGTTGSDGSQFLGPGGKVRIMLKGVLPGGTSKTKFTLATDQISCAVN